MKQKLTITMDSELVPVAKRYAKSKGVSLSALIEQALRDATVQRDDVPFGTKWRGKFKLAEKTGDPRYEYLVNKHVH
ncbi:MAG: DUF6364 family protein [Chloroflexi bacterium]|nr:DUF6364 family protein [Chloroflexota bacterium]